jgi:hypothetical protein|tara:strand:- start:871 stop:1062 length:192 start_codon:yes stop_codon:yes gene_type:complete
MKIKAIAMSTLTPELINGSRSPKPENERGPIKRTIKPPPIMIRIHIAKINENIERFIRYSLPS